MNRCTTTTNTSKGHKSKSTSQTLSSRINAKKAGTTPPTTIFLA